MNTDKIQTRKRGVSAAQDETSIPLKSISPVDTSFFLNNYS